MRFCALLVALVAAAAAWAAGYGPLVVALLAVIAWARTKRTARPAGGAWRTTTVRGHLHGGRDGKLIATHEAGHVAATRALGGRVRSARIWDDGGLVQATIPDTPLAAVTFLRAGAVAAGTSRGAGADNDAIRKELRAIPARERRDLERQATRDARRIVSRASTQIRRDAATMRERGRL
ncbi:hypothetical protein ACL02T_33020 [Pseudonocardia sp. RS010]|uniref:hypothetical protein n=1 Tax=Pseudonocardia sp. RS010 TaxID=3385979 RepID=UPI0039A35482